MRSHKDPKETIIRILSEHPEGLTFTSLAKHTGLHRHTTTKYAYELMGAGIISQRSIGMAKLCYLKENYVQKTRKNIGKKSETGQTQILAIFLFLLLVPSIIIAQNITNSSKLNEVQPILGEFSDILNGTTTTATTISLTTTLLETTTTLPEETTTTLLPTNTTILTPNETTIISTTTTIIPLNETTTTLPEETTTTLLPTNTTIPEETTTTTLPTTTLPETTTTTLSEIKPLLQVNLETPERVTRGETIVVKTIVTNNGSVDVKNVILTWYLPFGFDIISGDEIKDCGTLSPNFYCSAELTVQTSYSTELGSDEIKVVVSYEV